MLKIAFLCSGGGGNLRFIAEAIRLRLLPNAEICVVITDRECPAGIFAGRHGIPLAEYDFREPEQASVIDDLIHHDPGIIISNVHRILSPEVVTAFRGKLVNLHYSLLPAFGGVIGTKALDLALAYGVKFVGTTVHLVDDLLDGGAPLVQSAIPVANGDRTRDLLDTVFRAGCISLLTGVQMMRVDEQSPVSVTRPVIDILGRPVLFNPAAVFFKDLQDESFWSRLR